jgi:two-component system NtrC family response regulator
MYKIEEPKVEAQHQLLVVEDDDSQRRVLEYNLQQEGYTVHKAASAEEGLEILKSTPIDVVVSDIKMPQMSGIDLLSEIKRLDHDIQVILITAYATVDSAIEAMKLGAYDYIRKPLNRDELKIVVKKAVELRRLVNENIRLHQHLVDRFSFSNIISGNAKMKGVFEIMARVINSNVTVLITGESGTGKELCARAIHFSSENAKAPFVVVDCSSIPRELMESELFGHVKGAFTSAIRDKKGKFELADGGTIFLDEVGEIPHDLQAKLLRVLQGKEIDRVGGEKTIPVNVRVIAATNKNLLDAVKSGEFREDLYYRLNVVEIKLPPLRERKDDIPLLIQHFLHKFNANHCQIEPAVTAALLQYRWPGNIRELENVIQRAVVLRKEANLLTLCDFPDHIIKNAPVSLSDIMLEIPDNGIQLEEVEKTLLLKALQKADWNQTQAAKLLGITRQTLIYRMVKYNVKQKL